MDGPVVGVVGLIINTGFAALVGWYLLTKALPNMQANYLASQEKQQARYLDAQVAQREQYIAATKEQREHFLGTMEQYRTWFDTREVRSQGEAKSALAELMKHCERESARHDELVRGEMTLINTTLRQVMESFEDWRQECRQVEKGGGK